MAYNTPELLLVGAAQNVVLGFRGKIGTEENVDDDRVSYGEPTEINEDAW